MTPAETPRRVPEAFTTGQDRYNAGKAWLDGYDAASSGVSAAPCNDATCREGGGVKHSHPVSAARLTRYVIVPIEVHYDHVVCNDIRVEEHAEGNWVKWDGVKALTDALSAARLPRLREIRQTMREGRIVPWADVMWMLEELESNSDESDWTSGL